ncbi:MAG: NAD(P)H-binding protein [bacterium]|nr:NAD(P)H-binding protein [bacterium]
MIVVTTPTGQIGSQVLDRLLAAGERVRVISRNKGRLASAHLERVEVVEGSHGDAAVVRRAFEGADAVFWLVPPDPAAASVDEAYVSFTLPACEALRSQTVRHVVGVSSFGRGDARARAAGNITASIAMDDAIADTGVHYRALANASFMDNILRQARTINERGVFYSPTPADLPLASVATRDIAAVAVSLLTDRSWTGTADVALLGPEDISFREMAAIISDALRKPVRFQEIADDAMVEAMLARGCSEAMARAHIHMMQAVRAGIYTAAPRTSSATTPTTFRQWCAEVLEPAIAAL